LQKFIWKFEYQGDKVGDAIAKLLWLRKRTALLKSFQLKSKHERRCV
jgi:hypothetical protein